MKHKIHKIQLFWAVQSLELAFTFFDMDLISAIFHDDMNFSPFYPFGFFKWHQ